jgi:hypothetical protein
VAVSRFRAALRDELVAAAGRPLPGRPPPRRAVLVRAGLAVAALLALGLAAFVLPWGAERAPTPQGAALQPAGITGQQLFSGSLENGVRYRTRALVPAVSFQAAGAQWLADDAQSPTDLVLSVGARRFHPPRFQPPLLTVTFGRLPQVVDPRTNAALPAPHDLVGWLRAHPDLRTRPPVRVQLGGRPASRMDFTVVARPLREDPFCRQRFQIRCTQLAPNASIRAGSAGRLFVVPARPDPLVVAVLSSDPRRLPALIHDSEPLLASLRIGR